MKYALLDGQKVEAAPKSRGKCPGCGGETIAKCGQIKVWHWAHIGEDCDPWHEPESAWHLNWKKEVPSQRCEVVMGPHRADIVGANGLIVELQHSPISVDDIYAREDFYKRMIWLVDAEPFAHNVHFRLKDGFMTFRWKHPRPHHGSFEMPLFWDLEEFSATAIEASQFRMDDARTRLAKFVPPERLDAELEDSWTYVNARDRLRMYQKIAETPIFHVRKLHITPPCGGWGVFMPKQEFITRYLGGGQLL